MNYKENKNCLHLGACVIELLSSSAILISQFSRARAVKYIYILSWF